MPALAYSQDIQRRVAQIGFDWENIDGVIDKLAEEVKEFKQSGRPGGEKRRVRRSVFYPGQCCPADGRRPGGFAAAGQPQILQALQLYGETLPGTRLESGPSSLLMNKMPSGKKPNVKDVSEGMISSGSDFHP